MKQKNVKSPEDVTHKKLGLSKRKEQLEIDYF